MTASDQKALPLIFLPLIAAIVAFLWFQNDAAQEPLESGMNSATAHLPQINRARIPPPQLQSTEPDQPWAEVTMASPDTPLEFGAAVKTGTGRAIFQVVDKLHQKLDAKSSFHARLFRKFGSYWSRQGLNHDLKTNVITCAGHVGTGLEPGDYELTVSSPHYGNATKTFTVANGQGIRGFVDLPHWKRTIRLKYVDENGEPLHAIATKPRYFPPVTPQILKTWETPARVLAEPPAIEEEWTSYDEDFVIDDAYREDEVQPGIAYLTKDGYWELQVYAGGNGWLVQHVATTAEPSHHLRKESNFADAKWENYEIEVFYSDAEQRALETAQYMNGKTPGSYVIPPPAPFDPFDLERIPKNVHRLMFSSNHNEKLRIHARQTDVISDGPLVFVNRDSLAARRANYHALPDADDISYMDMLYIQGNKVSYWYSDGALLRTEELLHDAQQIMRAKKISRVNTTINSRPLVLDATLPTPTSKAWARGLQVAWNLDESLVKWQRINLVQDDHFAVSTARVVPSTEFPFPNESITLLFQGEDTNSNRCLKWPLSEAKKVELTKGKLTCDAQPKGFIARAVNQDGVGLPWVEAALIDMDEVHVSMSLQRRQRVWKFQDRLNRHFTNGPILVSFADFGWENLAQGSLVELGEEPPDYSVSDIKKMLPPDLFEELSSQEERRFFVKNYAWYDTHKKYSSDQRGYIVDWQTKLKPGKRYALFLWSNSRDHLSPDKTVIFTMTEGLKDLGAIRLPDYK
ncbi:MAG: hypothetical protein ACI97A_002726 [Planctomycetota bacterium]|jgi:hypothetical protein